MHLKHDSQNETGKDTKTEEYSNKTEIERKTGEKLKTSHKKFHINTLYIYHV